MTNFIEEQQREAKEGYWMTLKEFDIAHTNGLVDALIAQTITNTLNHILDSGLLEEMEELMPSEYLSGKQHGHNTLARAVKELLDKMSV